MNRRWLIILLALVAGLAGCQPDPVDRAVVPETPLRGWIDQPADGIKIKANDRGVLLSGWAAGGQGIARLEVVINGRPAGAAYYGQPRWDVIKFFPELGDPNVGFRAYLPADRPGRNDVLVRAIDRADRVKELYIHYFVEPAG